MHIFEIGSEKKLERSKEYASQECYDDEKNQILVFLHITDYDKNIFLYACAVLVYVLSSIRLRLSGFWFHVLSMCIPIFGKR